MRQNLEAFDVCILNRFTRLNIFDPDVIFIAPVNESLNRGIRKYAKIKSIFSSDEATLKADYLAIGIIEKK